MKNLQILAPAKLNLCIDIIGQDQSGYHRIQAVMIHHHEVRDTLNIFETDQNDNLSTLQSSKISPDQMGTMEANLAYKALKLFKKTLGISQNFSVQIEKNIPVASGLGGGSSDAAAVLVALNKLTGLNLEKEKLSLLAKKIGMDVPFFLESTPCLATHYGEKLTPLKPIKGITFKLLPQESWPTLPVENLDQKTEQMYATLDLEKCGKRLLQTDKLLKGIETGSPVEVLENLHNDFETLLDLDQNTYLSGAGPAVFTATVDNPN